MTQFWIYFRRPPVRISGRVLYVGKLVVTCPMPGGLQCSVHWFPPPVNYPSQYVERGVKQQITGYIFDIYYVNFNLTSIE